MGSFLPQICGVGHSWCPIGSGRLARSDAESNAGHQETVEREPTERETRESCEADERLLAEEEEGCVTGSAAPRKYYLRKRNPAKAFTYNCLGQPTIMFRSQLS